MTFLMYLAAAAGLMWLGWFVLRGSLIAGGMMFVLVAACFGFEFFQFDVGPISLTLDRLFLLVLAAMYVVRRRFHGAEPKPLEKLDLAIFAFLGLLVANMLWHGWQATPGQAVAPLWRLIAGYLVPFTVYWIAKQSPLDGRNVRGVHVTLAAFGLYLAVTGILEITQQWWLVFPRHIANPELGLHFGRARGPMLQSATFGLCLTVGLLGLLVCLPRLGWRWRVAAVALLPLYFASIYFSYTRTVWLGAALALFILLWAVLPPPRRLVLLGGTLVLGLVVALTQGERLVALKRDSSAEETKSSTVMRASFAYVSWQMFLDRPWWGCGFGHFPLAKRDYLADRSVDLPLTAIWHEAHHNVLLSLLTETGLFGMLLYVAILVMWTHAAWQLYSQTALPDWMRLHGLLMLGVLGAYLLALLFFELSYSPIDNALVFFLAGMTIGLRAKAGQAQPVRLPGLLGHWLEPRQSAAV